MAKKKSVSVKTHTRVVRRQYGGKGVYKTIQVKAHKRGKPRIKYY